MALTGVLRPGFAQIRVTDMDAAVRHYVDRVGLNEVSREPDGRSWASSPESGDHAEDQVAISGLVQRACFAGLKPHQRGSIFKKRSDYPA
jgi:hypothetical protein